MSKRNSYQRRIEKLKARVKYLEYVVDDNIRSFLDLVADDKVNVNGSWLAVRIRFNINALTERH